MKKPVFTPGYYNEVITPLAFKICAERKAYTKKEVNACFDEAIKQCGFSPAYVAKKMKELTPFSDDEMENCF